MKGTKGSDLACHRSFTIALRHSVVLPSLRKASGHFTVGDLYRFAMALQSHKLLDAAHTELLLTGKVDTGRGPDKYAFGFLNTNEDGMDCFGNGGGAPGKNGDLKVCFKGGYVIAVLASMTHPRPNTSPLSS